MPFPFLLQSCDSWMFLKENPHRKKKKKKNQNHKVQQIRQSKKPEFIFLRHWRSYTKFTSSLFRQMLPYSRIISSIISTSDFLTFRSVPFIKSYDFSIEMVPIQNDCIFIKFWEKSSPSKTISKMNSQLTLYKMNS